MLKMCPPGMVPLQVDWSCKMIILRIHHSISEVRCASDGLLFMHVVM